MNVDLDQASVKLDKGHTLSLRKAACSRPATLRLRAMV